MKFTKGTSGNPAGRPKGAKGKMSKSMLDKLLEISDKVEKHSSISQGKSIIEHFVERAYKSDPVLVAYMRKIISDRHYLTDQESEASIKHYTVGFEIIGVKPSDYLTESAEEIGDILIDAGLDVSEVEGIITKIGTRLDKKFLEKGTKKEAIVESFDN